MVINLLDDELRIYDPLQLERFRRFSGALVSGAYSRFFVIDTLQEASIMGVHFKPGGAFPFLDVPAGEPGDLHVNLYQCEACATEERFPRARTKWEAERAESKIRREVYEGRFGLVQCGISGPFSCRDR